MKSQLISEAKGVLAGMANTEQNYDAAEQMLHERYDENQLIVDAHYLVLFDLKAACNENSINLQSIVDSVEQHLNCLCR